MNITKTKRQNKKINGSFDYQVFTEPKLLEPTSLIQIFTNKEAKPKDGSNWFYHILDEDEGSMSLASGYVNLCDCSQCSSFGNQLSEYFSILRALTLVQKHSPGVLVELWVSSEGLFSERSEELFCSYLDKCPVLNELTKQLGSLLSKVKPEIFEYSYVNKDIIPFYF